MEKITVLQTSPTTKQKKGYGFSYTSHRQLLGVVGKVHKVNEVDNKPYQPHKPYKLMHKIWRCKVYIVPFLVLFLSIGFFMLPGCSEAPVQVKTNQPFYFDLKSYFKQEENRLAGLSKVKKVATVDGQREERTIDSFPLGEALNVFASADLNRPAWSDKYAIDSIYNESKQLVQLKYTAKEKELRTQHVIIDFEGNSVKKIFIENGSFTSVASTEQFLTYLPDEGYKIESRQKVAFTEGDTFLIEVRFLK